MKLTPEKIYENYNNRVLDKVSAVENLISIIENSDNINSRIEGIETLKKIDITDNKACFKLLENLLISDTFEKIRNTAAKVIKQKFLDKALEPMKWALQHEESPLCLNTIYNTIIEVISKLEREKEPSAKSLLLDEVKKMNERDFKISFEILCEIKPINDFTKLELASILINYFTLVFLKKTYWRLKYKIEKCKIIELNFIFKGLTSLPEAIKNLSSLKTLIFRYNQILSIPDWIGSLSSLESLNLNVNNIISLPESIGSLSSLKELSLWKNELNSLPKSIGSLSSLEILNLRLNQLETIPDVIGNITSLKELNLHDNKLSKLPYSIGSLSSLEKLNLSWNELKSIPESIGSLLSLKELDLGRNELDTIPHSISSLTSLKELNLSENKLTTIPQTIGNLSSLQILNLSRNELIKLPETLNKLTSLKELYVGDNRLINKYSKAIKNLERMGVQVYY
ncbi:MAG: leucine-rich repeat domain-containing protein [Candidatus Thorarchaeota archaeon]